MNLLFASSLLAALASLASAAPPLPPSSLSTDNDYARIQPNIHHFGASGGPCDLSSEDTGCYLIMDNSGCFLNTTDTARVLGCADPDPTKAIDIFCRCWGCNGQELVNFMPTLNCSSKTVIPKPVSVSGSNSTNATSTNSSSPATGKGTGKGKGAKSDTHMPVPILPYNE